MTQAQEAWARVRPLFTAFVDADGRYTVKYLETEIEAGRMVFWPSEHGAVLTRIVSYPNGLGLSVFAAVGEKNASLAEIVTQTEPRLVEFARASNCKWVVIHGRLGWERVGRRLGYRASAGVLLKEVS